MREDTVWSIADKVQFTISEWKHWIKRFIAGFNYRPVPVNHGHKYWLRVSVQSESICFYLCSQRWVDERRPPFISLRRHEPGGLMICDIQVRQSRHINKGVGTALLEIALAFAYQYRFNYVKGFVTKGDLDTTPYLLEWYVRHGFDVTMSSPSEPSVNSISSRNNIADLYYQIGKHIPPEQYIHAMDTLPETVWSRKIRI
jgi:hypothetical protein